MHPHLAKEYVTVAQALRLLSQTSKEFSQGRLSYSQVRLLVRVATDVTEQTLIYFARNSTVSQLLHVVGTYRSVLEADAEAMARHEGRHLTTWFDADGFFVLRGRLSPEDGAIVESALKQTMDGLTERDNEAKDPYGARQADALVQVARQSMAASATDRSTLPEVVVHMGLAPEGESGDCHLESGVALAQSTALRLSCEAALIPLIQDHRGRPLSVGRRTRSIPAPLRRALGARDAGCRFPGCAHKRHLHGHHVRHWAKGGHTSLENPVELCSFHHRLVHEGGYSVRPAEDGFEFLCRDGTVIPPVGRGTNSYSGDLGADRTESRSVCSEWLGERMNMQYVIGALLDVQSQGP